MRTIGPYQVVRELARGGMGAVYLAKAPDGEQVAIKLLLDAGLSDPELQLRFQREAEALQALEHPGILRVRSHGVDNGRLYTVMDLLSGPTLAEVVRRDGPLPEARAIALARRMASALGYAHAGGVVHRDLKPENVILEGDDPVLVDFGLARRLGMDASRLTETGTVMGSPNYMAPEQARGENHVGRSADQYGLGATLYFLLSGRPPFEGGSTLAILEAVAGHDPRPPRVLRPELSPALEHVVLRCLEKEPSRRYLTVFALDEALADLASSEPQRVAPSQRRLAWLAAGAAVAAAVGALTVGWLATAQPAPLAGPAARTSSPEQQSAASTHLERGRVLFGAGQLADALLELDQALQLDPTSVRAYDLRGKTRLLLGRHDEALEDASEATRLDPDLASAHRTRGSALFSTGKLGEAVRAYERALDLDPEDARTFSNLANVEGRLERRRSAIEHYSRALDLEPDSPLALRARGIQKVLLKDYRGAISDFDQSLSYAPDDASTRYYRGLVSARLEQYAEALKDLDLALGSGTLPEAARRRAVQRRDAVLRESVTADFREKRYSQALTTLERMLRLDPGNAQVHGERGVVLLELERFAEGLAAFDEALRLDPGHAPSHAQRARALLHLDRAEASLAASAESLRLEPWQAHSHSNRAEALQRLGRYKEAMRAWDQALKVDPSYATAYIARARALRSMGRAEEAVVDFERALLIDPKRASTHSRLGEVRLELGLYERAIEDFDEALRRRPGHASDLSNRGAAKARLGKLASALADLDQSLRLDAENGMTWFRRAETKSLSGLAAEAVEDYAKSLELGLDPDVAGYVRQRLEELGAARSGR